ncbi:MAG TPA: amphi-Trp domain-containing protein [Miltoncostaeaceae bacterium]|nr:amphi-Trp domain-containing protein [Miltoncostaeaceae bacterium]
MGDEITLYEEEHTLRREEAAARLRALADEIASNNGLQVMREGKRMTLRVPDRVELSIEIEQDGDEVEIEIELGWSGGPLAMGDGGD